MKISAMNISTPSVAALALAGVITVAGPLGLSKSPTYVHVEQSPVSTLPVAAQQPHGMISPIIVAALLATEWIAAARFVLTTYVIYSALNESLAKRNGTSIGNISTLDK